MSNRDIVKSYTAEAAINPCRFVKPGSNDYGVVQAAAAADKIIGVSMPLGSLGSGTALSSGDTCDVMHDGIADVQLGGSVTRGDLLTSDASGQGIVATGTAGSNYRTGGIALVSGVSGDIIPVLLTPGSFQG